MTREHAELLCDIIDIATEGNWPNTRNGLIDDRGHNPKDLVAAVNQLCELAGRSPILSEKDF